MKRAQYYYCKLKINKYITYTEKIIVKDGTFLFGQFFPIEEFLRVKFCPILI